MVNEKIKVQAEHISHITCVKCAKTLDVSHLPSFAEIKCPACGASQIVPARFSSFVLLEELGHGGMGVIYRAIDEELKRQVALKVMKKSLGANTEFVKSFKHEAQAAAALNHRNIVQIYSYGQFKGQPYIVMELVTGGGLDGVIEKGKQLDEVYALKILLDVTQGLKAASDVGLVHGDIKPANILFGKEGEAKVVDFGLASYIGQQEQGKPVWGTPYYIAPEKARGKKVDFRSDIYSLGGTIFHVLSGQPPFDATTPTGVVRVGLTQPMPDLETFRHDLHPRTVAMVKRMLEKEPTMRFPSYLALLADVREALDIARAPLKAGGKSSIISAVAAKPVFNRKTVAIAGASLAAILLIGGGIYGWKAYKQRQERIAAQEAEKRSYNEAAEKAKNALIHIADIYPQIEAESKAIEPVVEKINAIAKSVEQVKHVSERADEEVNKIKTNIAEATDILVQAQEAQNSLAVASESKTVKDIADSLSSLVVRFDEISQSILASITVVQQAHEDALAIREKAFEEAKRLQEVKRQEQDLKKAEEERKRRALVEAQAAEQRRKETIQAELDLIDEARAGNVQLVARTDFDKAIKALTKLLSKLSMEETREVLKNVRESYSEMAELKTFLISAIRSSPYPNGWVFGQKKRDIVRADARTGLIIALGNAGNAIVLWEQVSVSDLLRITSYYLNTLHIPDTEKARILFALGLLCYEHNDFSKAEACAKLACRLDSSFSAKTESLMPGLLSEVLKSPEENSDTEMRSELNAENRESGGTD